MAENFRKIVAAPEQAAAKLRKLIEKKNPTEYVRRGRAKKMPVKDRAGLQKSRMLRKLSG